MELIGKTGFFGDLFDQDARRLESLGPIVHFEAQEKPIRRLLVIPAKQPAKVSLIQMAFACGLLDGA